MVRKKNKMFVDSADRTPHYSLRKLSVGVASVLLSTTLWMGANGSVAHADTINDATVAGKGEDKLDPSEMHKDQTQAQTAEATSQTSVASAEKQNGEAQKGQAQVAVANANQAENKQAQEVDSTNAEAQTATANDAHAQADVAKQEPTAQSQQTAPQAQVSAPASAKEQASTAEGQTNGSANADAAIDVTTEEKKDSANPEANSSDAATEDAKNESTTLDVSQALKTSAVAAVNNKMVMAMASLANTADPSVRIKRRLAKANPDTTAVPGFSVTDPEYPSEMYRDPDPEHYTFYWVGQEDNGYQTVISTNRNGDGQIHVFELNRRNTVINSFDLDKNRGGTSWWTGVTYYNDEYAGLVQAGSSGGLTLKYEVSGGKTDQPANSISFIVPRLNTQVTSYQGEDGKDIIDNNGEKIEPVVQQGLDGQKYTTTGTKVIDGYYAKAPSNAQGTMSPYGKIGSTYEINMHNGYSAVFTQTDNDGTMSAQMYYEDRYGDRFFATRQPKTIKPGDTDIPSGVDGIYLRSIYVPQTIDIRYVYKKLGNTVLVDEDNNPFMGNTPTQYPNDSNDPTKAGKVVIPQYKGYTPKINGVPVGPDGFIPTNPGEDTKVVYTANSAAALVRFIDNNDNSTLTDLKLEGKTDKTIDFATAKAQLNSYLDRGYKLVANGIPKKETKFDTSADTDVPSQVFVVQLDHDTVTVTQENPVTPGSKINPKDPDPDSPTYTSDQAKVTEDHTLTVYYVGAPNNPADKQQKSHWTREVTIDKVTGKTLSSTDWATTDSYVKVDTPEIAGYTPDAKVVVKPTVRKDQEVTVTYTANSAAALVRFIDNNDNSTLTDLKLEGKTDKTIDFATAKAQLNSYLDRGYKLVANGIPKKETKFDTSADTDVPSQVFVVQLDHTKTTSDPKVEGKQTVTYVYKDKDGKVVKTKKVEEGTTFTGNTTKDEVTGETTTTWEQKNHTYKPVNTPVEPGYTADKKIVGGETVTPDDPNRSYIVVYTPNGSIVPVDPNGNPIPGTNPIPYETDPTDPTKVVDGKVPEVPGWTPKNGKPGDPVVPTDPTKDTKVPYVYTKVVDDKVPEVPSWTPKNGKPGDPVKPIDPTKDTKVPDDHTMTPGETTVTGKVEGLPEKPAKSAKAPAEKLVKTPVKVPKAVKEASPAEMPAQKAAQAQDQLPQTGEDNSKAAFGLGLASILGGIGILGTFKRKKKEN